MLCLSLQFANAYSSDALPRNVVLFVIDISGSMKGRKLQVAKTASIAILDNLTDQDNIGIHNFSDSGTEDYLGPSSATQEAKEAVKAWVNDLTPYGGTNLEEGHTNGIERVQDMMDTSTTQQEQASGNVTRYAPIVMVLTDGRED